MTDRVRKLSMVALALVLAIGACDDGGPDTLGTPSNVAAAAQSPSRIRVTWNAVSGAQSYVIERAPGASGGTFEEVGTATTTSYDDANLTPSSTYRYRVAALAGTNRGLYSTEIQVQTQAPGTVVVNADITANRTFFRDTIYRLSGFIHVQPPAVLTIEAGTTIQGDFSIVGSSLFIMRGARIQAVGTADAAIVFTSSQAPGQRRAGDWGGLIVVGNAQINKTGVINLEGTGTDASNPNVNYGQGTNDADNSGVLRYVRVEFAGYGPRDAQELNTFTFAAVGSGTQLSYLQAMSGLDDSFEWFGGTVDGKYFVSYDAGDDHFDMSEGYRGRLQYLIAFQSSTQPNIRPGAGNTSGDPVGIENDGCDGPGCTDGRNSIPLTIPLVANFTLVGSGPGTWVSGTGSGGYGMVLRRGTGGYYVNGLIARWPRGAIGIRDADTQTRINNGDFILRNVLVASDNAALFQAGQLTVDATANAIVQVQDASAALFTAAPVAPANAAALDFTPPASSAGTSGGLATFTGNLAAKAGTFVAGTAFRGAAPPTGADVRWWAGWTNFANN